MAEEMDNFELYTKLVAKICETKLAYLISKDVSFEFVGQEDSKINERNVQLEKDAMALIIPLEAIESSLVLHSDLEQIPAIADIFAGGDGEVAPELTETQRMVFLDTSTQFLTSVFKYLVFKGKDLQLEYGDTKEQSIEAGKETALELYGTMEPIAYRLKLTINDKSIEFVVNVDKAHYENFIEKLSNIFPNVNLDTIIDQLKKELNTTRANTKFDLEPGVKSNKEDALYMVDEKRNLGFISDVNLDLIVELGRVDMEFSDVLNLAKGSAIELDRHCSESVDLYVHNPYA